MSIWQMIGFAMMAALPIGGFIMMVRDMGLKEASANVAWALGVVGFIVVGVLLATGRLP